MTQWTEEIKGGIVEIWEGDEMTSLYPDRRIKEFKGFRWEKNLPQALEEWLDGQQQDADEYAGLRVSPFVWTNGVGVKLESRAGADHKTETVFWWSENWTGLCKKMHSY